MATTEASTKVRQKAAGARHHVLLVGRSLLVDHAVSMHELQRDTIQCRAVEHLLRATARAEARHFWFRGFRAFVTPLLRHADGTSFESTDSGLRLRHRREPRAARPVRNAPSASTCPRQACRSAARWAACAWRAPASRRRRFLPARFDVVDVVRRAVFARGCRRAGRTGGDVSAAEARRLRHHQRRRDGRAAGRPFGAEPRGSPVQPGRCLRERLGAAGFSVVRITYTNFTLLPPLADRARAAAQARASERSRREAGNLGSARAGERAADRTAARGEPLDPLVRRARGSSLLCLARKPAS